VSKLDTIIEELRGEHSRITEERAAVEASLRQMDDDLKRVAEALAALGQKPKAAKSGKPAPKREDVEQAAVDILSKSEALQMDELKAKVESSVTAAGFSKMGLALRLKEALASERFVESPAGWKCVEEFAQTSNA